MTPGQLAALARATFGKQWKGTLAPLVGYSRRQLDRYASGHVEIADETAEAICEACLAQSHRRHLRVVRLIKRISGDFNDPVQSAEHDMGMPQPELLPPVGGTS